MKTLSCLYLVLGFLAGCWGLNENKRARIRDFFDALTDSHTDTNQPTNFQSQGTTTNGNQQVKFSEFSPPQSSFPNKNNLASNSQSRDPVSSSNFNSPPSGSSSTTTNFQSNPPSRDPVSSSNFNFPPPGSSSTKTNSQSNPSSQGSFLRPSANFSPPRSSSSSTNLYVNPEPQEAIIIDSIQDLALDLSATQWEQGNIGNVVQSPVSISSVLSLILLGCRGDTHAELKRALRFPNNIPDAIIHETYQRILGSLIQSASGISVTMGSRLFLQQQDFNVLGTYTQLAQSHYNSSVRGLDFARQPVEATNEVNKFVEETTNGHIKNLISQPFPSSTKFVAVNTIYFNGNWDVPFPKALTKMETFDTGKRNITIPMMTNILTVPYLNGEKSGFDMISLPYKGGRYSMIVITPRGTSGTKSLMSVEYSLESKAINQLIASMKPTQVAVKIPRMKLNHKIHLKRDLNLLNVQSIFDPSLADFGRLTTDPDLYLNDVVHEAVIEVTETGTVAAAATSSSLDRIGGAETFHLNQPSIILIRDITNDLTLFYVRVVEPEPILN